MAPADCPSPEHLQRLLARELDETACAAAESHIEGCADCQAVLERLTDFRGDFGTGVPPPQLGDPQFWRALKDAAQGFTRSSPAPPPAGLFARSGFDSNPESEQRELTEQLRRRLPVAYAATASVLGVGLLIIRTGLYGELLGPLGKQLTTGTFGPWSEALLALTVASLAGSAAFVWRRGSLSAGALRRLETANFALLVWLLADWHFHLLISRPPGGFEGPAHEGTFILYADFAGLLNWVLIMVQAGLFLPQTRGRCTALMAAEILAGMAATMAAAWANPAVARMLGVLLIENAQGLLGGAALCIYGTIKARALERELRAARHEARHLGQYHLKRLLGSGGMGEVYLAEHRLLKRPCAVKVIHPDRAGNPEALRRFEREVQATAQLRHPNTVEVFDYGCAEDGTFYYVMEYLDGLSLDRLVKRHGPLSVARAVHIVRQLCGALREAHAAGLIHRDIKPANVLVCRNGPPDRAKLLDFGLVRMAGPTTVVTQQDRLLGTPGYMAPEQIEGAEAVGALADLYSLGALTYYLLTGQPPFERDTPMRTLVAQLREAPPPPSHLQGDIPPALETVVLRCLSKEPADRYTSVTELDRALGGCGVGNWSEDAAMAWWAERERGVDAARHH